ncbi:hypothetical protein GC173_00030 [bacterium]|nr:hypothetical protein [bacterium]
MSRLVVVDASVLRSAGESSEGVSASCREYLKGILQICHKVVVTEELTTERLKHHSRFSRKWFGWMTARRKQKDVKPNADLHLALDKFSEKARIAIEKDLLLIQAACAADKIIVTEDTQLMSYLSEHKSGERWLREIRWIVPSREPVEVLSEL